MAAGNETQSAGNGGATSPQRFRTAIEYGVGGDLRFISHHDEMRLMARALVRARWPLSYTRGFNPRPRVRLPLPRPVGLASASQWALADLNGPREPDELYTSLAACLPGGCRLRQVVAPAPEATPHPQRAVYTIALEPAEAQAIEGRLAGLTTRDAIPVLRDYGPDEARRTVDIRPYIESVELIGGELRMALVYREQRTARPGELLTELGFAAEESHHRLQRSEIQWDIELAGPSFGAATDERN